MSALSGGIHKDGCGGIFAHHGACFLAGYAQSLFGVVYDQFLAECVDETLGSSAYHKLVWRRRGEAYGIADLVSPQAAGCGNEHGVVFAYLNAPDGHDVGTFALQFVQWNKLVEDVVVQHE